MSILRGLSSYVVSKQTLLESVGPNYQKELDGLVSAGLVRCYRDQGEYVEVVMLSSQANKLQSFLELKECQQTVWELYQTTKGSKKGKTDESV